MNRTTLGIFCAIILSITALDLFQPGSFLQSFVTENGAFSAIRIVFASILLLALILDGYNIKLIKQSFTVISLFSIALGLFYLFSPTLGGYIQSYVLPLDAFIAIESGILVLGATLKMPRPEPLFRSPDRLKTVFKPINTSEIRELS